ncbi:ABC transporter ATP-binding protein [Haladaptatus cibarius]|uniref:ABC transporter ATP-binding protein n=1 Tax=Haladaptatus cibarius TaxID=453847 RepID=UPI000679A537|nr:ABC transporter ATP-binding protein [Haladaptatus cibarius]
MSETIIKVDDVSKSFDEGGILDGLSLEIEDDELTLLMGPNGAGKTVLLACLAGGLNPTDGSIRVFGQSPKEARSYMSFMIQGGLALPYLNGYENISFYEGLHPSATEDWREIVDMMDLTEDLDRPVRDYSGGMKQKLELSIALSTDVPLYLLDEPTSELDMTTIDQLHSLLQDELEREKAVVMTSHTPRDVDIADRIVFVNHGGVVASGKPTELRDNVPSVVRIVGGRDSDNQQISEFVRNGRLFESGQDRRGFLRDDADVEQVRSAIDTQRAEVTVERTSHEDMFNYYTRIHAAE